MSFAPFFATVAAAAAALASATPAPDATAHPTRWPAARSPFGRDAKVEARVDALLARMSVEDKVAQLLQVDIASIKPEDLREIRVGSVLNGGNSAPGNNELAPAADWLALADAFWRASTAPRADGRSVIIPVIWGTDAVHGHNNIVGATLFPHNIGLGAARDPDLVRRIGRATAEEVAATGIDWTFGPTLAVTQDDRWGRTYESYGEDPALVASYAGPMVEGVQGKPGTPDFLTRPHVIATAKHFLGDGGTGGRDQGDTRVDEATLARVHGAGYPPAIDAGTLAIMASFSSWNGAKMHGSRSLLTDVLKRRMGFAGLVVGDWNAHAQLPGCSVDHCAAAINAGLDMFMISGDWRALYRNTLADVRGGAISAARLDDAVRRILRVKALAGALDAGAPSTRGGAGRFDRIGAPDHRALAREAVRVSLVLLKNEGVLPLRPQADVLVAGRGADSIAQASGGWSITWQGTDVADKDFPKAQSIWSGIREAVGKAGGHATLSPDGAFTRRPDAAIMVFGETPYAEFAGDRPTLEYSPGDRSDVGVLRRLKAAGIPVVAVFLSGRPLWVNAELNASDAFVAAFLPGTEGGGVADVLFRRADGGVAHDFRGKLSFSWPARPDQYRLNRGDPDYRPLFAYGYGLSYAKGGHVPSLDETRPAGLVAATPSVLFGRGGVPAGWRLLLEDGNGATSLTGPGAASPDRVVTATAVDRAAQEDARRFTWSGGGFGQVEIEPPRPLDLQRETNGELSLVLDLRVDARPTDAVDLKMASGTANATVAIGPALTAAATNGWTSVAVPLRCFAKGGLDPTRVSSPVLLSTPGRLALSVSGVRIASVAAPTVSCQ